MTRVQADAAWVGTYDAAAASAAGIDSSRVLVGAADTETFNRALQNKRVTLLVVLEPVLTGPLADYLQRLSKLAGSSLVVGCSELEAPARAACDVIVALSGVVDHVEAHVERHRYTLGSPTRAWFDASEPS